MFRQENASLPIFKGLSAEQIAELYGMMELCLYAKEETVFVQGQCANSLFILLSGEIIVEYKPYDGPPLTVTRIPVGGVFGWSAALGRETYSSTARAVENCEVLCFSTAQLRSLCENHPDIGSILLDRLASGIGERLQNTHDQILTMLSQGIDINWEISNGGSKNE
jgi:CRP/FNR family transcriptional regulator, cyclic AMP receptor protein